MKYKVTVTKHVPSSGGCIRLIKKAVRRTLTEEKIERRCAVGVLIAGPEEIRLLNVQMRGVDSVTDVLSFPALELLPGQQPEPDVYEGSRYIYLGDMAINLERAAEQAEQYGHSLQRECAYLAVHSVLHLLGYDHMDEGEEKRRMRSREEAVLSSMSLTR